MEYLSAEFIAKTKDWTDEKIVEKLKEDFDPQLFALLVNRYEAQLLERCKTYVKDEDIAQDIVQDVFVKLFRHLCDFRQSAKFSHWLFTIANNTSLDYLRKENKKKTIEISEELVGDVDEIANWDERLNSEISIETLDELLDQLNPQDKLILLLKYKKKTPIKTIQGILNISESAVKMRLKRAKEKIARLYKNKQ